ncbi:hypothetical protein ZHAS_00007296 [Anopheles sinensis]|uniref:Uncharacterized protein n=1 Tax=Anopheles sinensis TaxID=74873 RepID=A0A084VPM2_ANOSI|nr:hypothetical protein ZHAS_00007296 [Anopheles sinensis]
MARFRIGDAWRLLRSNYFDPLTHTPVLAFCSSALHSSILSMIDGSELDGERVRKVSVRG